MHKLSVMLTKLPTHTRESARHVHLPTGCRSCLFSHSSENTEFAVVEDKIRALDVSHCNKPLKKAPLCTRSETHEYGNERLKYYENARPT